MAGNQVDFLSGLVCLVRHGLAWNGRHDKEEQVSSGTHLTQGSMVSLDIVPDFRSLHVSTNTLKKAISLSKIISCVQNEVKLYDTFHPFKLHLDNNNTCMHFYFWIPQATKRFQKNRPHLWQMLHLHDYRMDKMAHICICTTYICL